MLTRRVAVVTMRTATMWPPRARRVEAWTSMPIMVPRTDWAAMTRRGFTPSGAKPRKARMVAMNRPANRAAEGMWSAARPMVARRVMTIRTSQRRSKGGAGIGGRWIIGGLGSLGVGSLGLGSLEASGDTVARLS